MAFGGNGVISVVLNYGANADWVRTVLAAGTAGVAYRGGRFALTDPQILTIGAAQLPQQARSVGDPSRKVLRAVLTAVDGRTASGCRPAIFCTVRHNVGADP